MPVYMYADRYIHPLKYITNAAYHTYMYLIWYIFEINLAPHTETVV